MNLLTIFHRFPDHKSCIEHLEHVPAFFFVRWFG